ncbi:hypothetical protein KSS87_001944 [Heliosperma pusillum]|nr:hypothetical protein KSS87_001944 [Heliosperma pusillum]
MRTCLKAIDVFNKFKNEDGTFKESLTKDVVGMLNLYEASYLRLHGEEILDEAINFTTNHLKVVLGQLSQPLLAQVTQALTLPLHYVIDDTYDAYGFFGELQVYTKAVERWDKSCMDQLPDFMKITYEALLDTFQGFELNLAAEGRSHLVSYVRELMKEQCRAYIQEAKWCNQKYVPSYDEYLNSAAITTAGYTIMSAAIYLGMGELATEEAFKWVSQTPKPVRASCIIGRVVGDIASHKLEKNRNHVASAVQCYMSQYGVSEEEAEVKLRGLVEEAWKDLNQEMLRPTKLPRPLMMRILSLSRVIEVFYRLGEDDYTVVSDNMKEKIHAVLIDPVMV